MTTKSKTHRKSDPRPQPLKLSDPTTCRHWHLEFGMFGQVLTCRACGARYMIQVKGYNVADVGYVNTNLVTGDLRVDGVPYMPLVEKPKP